MQEQSPHTQQRAVTQGRASYSLAELALIERLAHGTAHKAEIERLFPERTVAAVKQQIVAARHRLGLIEPQPAPERRSDSGFTMLRPDEEPIDDNWHIVNRQRQTAANGPFLAALFAAMPQRALS